MAEIVLSPFIQATLDRLFKEVLGELRLFWGCDEDIENLGTTLRIILGVLADAEEKQQKEHGVKAWLTELEEAARDVDNILDLCRTQGLRRKMLETEGSLFATFFSAFNSVPFGKSMAHKMKDIRKRLDIIVQVGQNLGLNNSRRVTEVIIREETDSYVSESAVKGRKEDRKEIVEKLLDMGKEEKVWIISVVGMGGLGKTTLAQLIFNDAKMKERFPLRIWVCVSDDYDTKKLIRKMLESANHSICETDSLQLLRSNLQQALSGKKFFLVLDDVWHKEGFDWERLISYLEAGEMGSKILVTTRSQEDASKVGTHEVHRLNGLSEDDCWDLFYQRAFGRGVWEQNQRLINIGKEIVKKCGGLPLAVKAVGGLMRSKRGESEWRAAMESEIWNNILIENNILPLLRWSYNNLPSHLKPCFAYYSVFPKDYEVEVEELIRLWMAEGLILSSQGSRPTEAIGREYFQNLLQRSFFQEAETKPDAYGKIVVRCKMHDLMHDLAMAVSKDALSISTEDCRITVLDKYRGLFVDMSQRRRQEESITCITSSSAKKLKTLFIRKAIYAPLSTNFFTHLPFLRVLSLSGVDVTEDTLNSVSWLQQLRYLSLKITCGIITLPNSLSYLLNLQTLRLEHCWELKDLPKDMRKMKSLRHLDIDGWWTLTRMPTKMGELTSLQTLPVFIVGKGSGCNIRELKNLRELTGGLEIRQLENVRDKSEAEKAKLSEKENIESLGLMFSKADADSRECYKEEETLEALQPHSSLRELNVGNYYGSRLPHWMSTCSSLEVLILTDLANLEELDFTDQLNRLLTLRIRKCKNLESMSRGLGKLGALEELVIVDCPKLVSLFLDDDDQMQCLTRLRKLKVSRCDGLMSLRLDRFTALTTVIFEKCGNLKSFAGEMHHGLTALQSIMIIECPMVGSLLGGMEYLTSLRELYIYRCDELTGLPEGLKHATQLEILELRRLRNLSALPEWIGNLSSLRSLSIEICYKLASLPFDVFQQLTNLHSIRIAKCSYELQKRCEKDTGEDWHKLSHIENVEFDPRRIYTNDTTADYSYGFRVQPRAHRMVLESTNDFGD